ncbi:MAG: autotransporter domain-containing protein [Chlamydiia bacterium]|nr:autotransporter domain-containing protein [Chlamydiia bacterium]
MSLCCGSLHAATFSITTNSDDETNTASLPYALIHSAAGDTIDCTPIAGQTITLGKPLPAIVKNLTVSGGTLGPVTIDGIGSYQGFSLGSGTSVTVQNFSMQNCRSIGGTGGSGNTGGGGGVAGGGALYIHNGVNVTINHIAFSSNQAIGGDGGDGQASPSSLGCGGGGGGFCSGSPLGAGENGSGGNNGGGGGGGHSGAGSGGSTGGGTATGISGLFLGGGGGGSVGLAGGGASNAGGPTPSNLYAGGTSSGTNGGGGGAGAGGAGGNATSITGGIGGVGLGIDTFFGAGGGGGGGGLGNGGNGLGAGGGGAASGGGIGGSGGAIGGGGGGGLTANSGGAGGFGAGGGGSGAGSAGGTPGVCGGNGGLGIGAGGGGGAGFGGAIFIQQGALLTIGDSTSFSGNSSTGGAGGTASGSGTAGAAGTHLGADLFLQSGGTIIFNLVSSGLTVASSIDSDQGGGGGSGGGVTLTGTNTLVLSSANTYTGTTTIVSGILNIAADSGLGIAANPLIIGTGTLQIAGALTSARSISLTGSSIIDTQGNALGLSGPMTGGGSLNFIGTGSTVSLSGANSYSGGTNISSGITLQGSTASLQGAISVQAIDSTLIFNVLNQSGGNLYAGALSGLGFVLLQGSGTIQLSAASPSFTGTMTVSSGVELNMNGSIANAGLLTIVSGATLSGSGTVGNVTNSGTISPGNSLGTIHVNGNLSLQPSSQLSIELAPGGFSDAIAVTGTAQLDGNVLFTPTSGFYGFQSSFSFLTSSGLGGSTFASFSITNPSFTGTIVYPGGNNAVLLITISQPFLEFPYGNFNEAQVGNYVDLLSASGQISLALRTLLDTLTGASNDAINKALDQMHPAPYSAIAEMQAEVGGQLVSLFHRRPYLSCGCERERRVWVAPFGNWLREGSLGEQFGLEALTKGIAVGCDMDVGSYAILGIGGTWNQSDLTWHSGHGSGTVDRYLGALYADLMASNFYCGLSILAGVDDNNLTRHIQFASNELSAKGSFLALDLEAQIASAYFFGIPSCLFYPYLNIDFFHLGASGFTETGAETLALHVSPHAGGTLRTEAGIALQIQNTNDDETICISPKFILGWSMECPLYRPLYKAHFIAETSSFRAQGWNHTWQMFVCDLGLKLTYRACSLSGSYLSEIVPDGQDSFWGQRCNIVLDFTW